MAIAERELAPQAQKRLYMEEEYLTLQEAAEEKIRVCQRGDAAYVGRHILSQPDFSKIDHHS